MEEEAPPACRVGEGEELIISMSQVLPLPLALALALPLLPALLPLPMANKVRCERLVQVLLVWARKVRAYLYRRVMMVRSS